MLTQLLLNPEFLDAFAQGRAGDAEHFGGVHLVAVGFFEGLDDQFAFDCGNHLELRIAPRPLE